MLKQIHSQTVITNDLRMYTYSCGKFECFKRKLTQILFLAHVICQGTEEGIINIIDPTIQNFISSRNILCPIAYRIIFFFFASKCLHTETKSLPAVWITTSYMMQPNSNKKCNESSKLDLLRTCYRYDPNVTTEDNGIKDRESYAYLWA